MRMAEKKHTWIDRALLLALIFGCALLVYLARVSFAEDSASEASAAAPAAMSAEDYFALGKELAGQGDFRKAIEKFEEASRLNPDSADAQFQMGLAYEKLGEYDNAVEAFAVASWLNPELVEAKAEMAAAYDKLTLYSDSKVVCGAAMMQSKPDIAGAYKNLADAYSAMNRWADAIRALSQAILLDPKNPSYPASLGAAYANVGKFDAAIEACKKAIELKSDEPELHYALALIYLKMEDRKSAAKELEVVKKLDAGLANKLAETMKY